MAFYSPTPEKLRALNFRHISTDELCQIWQRFNQHEDFLRELKIWYSGEIELLDWDCTGEEDRMFEGYLVSELFFDQLLVGIGWTPVWQS